MRLHIIANSDCEKDQRVKLLVRNYVLNTERERLNNVQDGEGAARYIMEDAAKLLSGTEALLRENGLDYGARLCLGVYPFPTRSYADKVYPAGDYTALRIVLGEGAGRNWWCVLFPPLCILEDEAGKIEYTETGDIKWKSLLREWMEKGEADNEKTARDEFFAAAVHSISSDAVPYADGGSRLAEAGQQR